MSDFTFLDQSQSPETAFGQIDSEQLKRALLQRLLQSRAQGSAGPTMLNQASFGPLTESDIRNIANTSGYAGPLTPDDTRIAKRTIPENQASEEIAPEAVRQLIPSLSLEQANALGPVDKKTVLKFLMQKEMAKLRGKDKGGSERRADKQLEINQMIADANVAKDQAQDPELTKIESLAEISKALPFGPTKNAVDSLIEQLLNIRGVTSKGKGPTIRNFRRVE